MSSLWHRFLAALWLRWLRDLASPVPRTRARRPSRCPAGEIRAGNESGLGMSQVGSRREMSLTGRGRSVKTVKFQVNTKIKESLNNSYLLVLHRLGYKFYNVFVAYLMKPEPLSDESLWVVHTFLLQVPRPPDVLIEETHLDKGTGNQSHRMREMRNLIFFIQAFSPIWQEECEDPFLSFHIYYLFHDFSRDVDVYGWVFLLSHRVKLDERHRYNWASGRRIRY